MIQILLAVVLKCLFIKFQKRCCVMMLEEKVFDIVLQHDHEEYS